MLEAAMIFVKYVLIYPLWIFMCCDIVAKFVQNVGTSARKMLRGRRTQPPVFAEKQTWTDSIIIIKNEEIIGDNSKETNNNDRLSIVNDADDNVRSTDDRVTAAANDLRKAKFARGVRLLKQAYEAQNQSELERAFALRRRNSEDTKPSNDSDKPTTITPTKHFDSNKCSKEKTDNGEGRDSSPADEEREGWRSKTVSLISKFEANQAQVPHLRNDTFTADDSTIIRDVHNRKVVTSLTQLFEKQKPKLQNYVRPDRIVNLMKISKDERNSQIKHESVGALKQYFQSKSVEKAPTRSHNTTVTSTDEIIRSQRFSRNLSEYSISEYLDDHDCQADNEIDAMITPEPPIVPSNLRRTKGSRKSFDRESLKRLSQQSLSDLFDKIEQTSEFTSENLEELKKLTEQFAQLADVDMETSRVKVQRRPRSMYVDDSFRPRRLELRHMSMENLSASPSQALLASNRAKSNERLYRKMLARSSESLHSRSRPTSACEDQVRHLFNYIIDHKTVESVDQILNDETFSRDFSDYSITGLLDSSETSSTKPEST